MLSLWAAFAVTEIRVCLHLQLFDMCVWRRRTAKRTFNCVLHYYITVIDGNCVVCDMYENNYVIYIKSAARCIIQCGHSGTAQLNEIHCCRAVRHWTADDSHSRAHTHAVRPLDSIKVKCIWKREIFLSGVFCCSSLLNGSLRHWFLCVNCASQE